MKLHCGRCGGRIRIVPGREPLTLEVEHRWPRLHAPIVDSHEIAAMEVDRRRSPDEGDGYPCSVDGKPCPCGSMSEDCR